MPKVIQLSLDPQSIGRAVKEVKAYKREIEEKTELLRKRVAQKIAQMAQSGFNGAIVDDLTRGGARMASVSVEVNEHGDVSVVIASGEDAVWAEFGTGVYHNGPVGTSPHPKGSELGMTIGGYGKGMGAKTTWGFREGDELFLTHGAPASMPMYSAFEAVRKEIAAIAKEVFG